MLPVHTSFGMTTQKIFKTCFCGTRLNKGKLQYSFRSGNTQLHISNVHDDAGRPCHLQLAHIIIMSIKTPHCNQLISSFFVTISNLLLEDVSSRDARRKWLRLLGTWGFSEEYNFGEKNAN